MTRTHDKFKILIYKYFKINPTRSRWIKIGILRAARDGQQ